MLHKIKTSGSYVTTDLFFLQPTLQRIQHYYDQISSATDTQLQVVARRLRQRAVQGEEPDRLLPEAYALIKEAFIRRLGLYPFEVQLLAAIALHDRRMVEMQTGEGKTLAAVFPVCMHALAGRGVHVLTFNDYLARRDAQWMGPVYAFLGLSVAYINEGQTAAERKQAYRADVTYATAKAIGFDYLRSGIALSAEEQLLRPFYFALVDEADAILIDEARHPLVLAGNVFPSTLDFHRIARFVSSLLEGKDLDFDDYRTNVFLTDTGIGKVEHYFQRGNLHAPENQDLHAALNLALQARFLLRKDVEYIVVENEVKLVDEFTGRVIEDRKWRDGLQTAVEAKEGLEIKSEGNILNAVTLQHLLQHYPQLAGMTATAQASAEEFATFYGLTTVVIPPNRPRLREDLPDLIFTRRAAKERALLAEIKKVHATGQPLLIGTLSVKESEELAGRLWKEGVGCQVLNARNDESEAAIIARAGCSGAVTISTNMAGRGTDIVLGGGDPADREKVIGLGGLYVIGTNRHESLRIDQQLRGRAGRQGDVGMSRFFISFEDELLIKYKFKEILPKRLRKIRSAEAVQHKRIAKFIRIMQRIIESRFFDMRKALYEFSSFMEKQRLVLQTERVAVLEDDHALQERIGVVVKDEVLRLKLRRLILLLYDRYWAVHLDFLTQTREGIYIVQLGGQNPLREFRRMADEHFQEILSTLDSEIPAKVSFVVDHPTIDLSELDLQRPEATWTYIVHDNPFGNQLALMLLDNSNIGFTADPISAIALFFYALLERRKKRNG